MKAKELRAKKDPNPTRAYDDSNTEYEDIAYEKCFDYVTLLNSQIRDQDRPEFSLRQRWICSFFIAAIQIFQFCMQAWTCPS